MVYNSLLKKESKSRTKRIECYDSRVVGANKPFKGNLMRYTYGTLFLREDVIVQDQELKITVLKDLNLGLTLHSNRLH